VKVITLKRRCRRAFISRGDRNLCKVIERAWRWAAALTGWTEHFDFAKDECFEIEGVANEPYLREFPVREFDKQGAPLVHFRGITSTTTGKARVQCSRYTKGINGQDICLRASLP